VRRRIFSANTLSVIDDMMPAPKMRKPAALRISPNSTVYQ